jgi:hypothetical protein
VPEDNARIRCYPIRGKSEKAFAINITHVKDDFFSARSRSQAKNALETTSVKLLSPSTRATDPSPMKSRPLRKACAKPSGFDCCAADRDHSLTTSSEQALEARELR